MSHCITKSSEDGQGSLDVRHPFSVPHSHKTVCLDSYIERLKKKKAKLTIFLFKVCTSPSSELQSCVSASWLRSWCLNQLTDSESAAGGTEDRRDRGQVRGRFSRAEAQKQSFLSPFSQNTFKILDEISETFPNLRESASSAFHRNASSRKQLSPTPHLDAQHLARVYKQRRWRRNRNMSRHFLRYAPK